ncbi:uncharacterized protein [Dysidea avara]|uniref:uncharacterized protein n=1 Tax=Dysidea avara TaxID=196820 RepID=UPI0033318A40
MEMLTGILLLVIVVITAATITAIVVITTLNYECNNTQAKSELRYTCCGRNIEPATDDSEIEVVFGEIRYPEVAISPQQFRTVDSLEISFPNAKLSLGNCNAMKEHGDGHFDLCNHTERIHQQPGNNPDKNIPGDTKRPNIVDESHSDFMEQTIKVVLPKSAPSIEDTNLAKHEACAVMESSPSSYYKPPINDTQSECSDLTTEEEQVAVVPNPAYNFKETYAAAQKVVLQPNPSYGPFIARI